MDIKKFVKRTAVFSLSCIAAVCPPVLYLFLLDKSCSSSLMYSADKLWTVVIVSVLCASVVWLILKRPLYKEESIVVAEDNDGYEQEELSATPVYDNTAAMEEYPELFLNKEFKEDNGEGAPAFYEALSEMMAAEKREYVSEEDGGAAEILSAREILESGEDIEKKNAESLDRDISIYENIPMELPEGYVSAKVYDPKEDEPYEEEGDQEVYEEKRRPSLGETVLSKVVVTAVFTLAAFLSAIAFSTEYTLYEKDSVTVCAFGKESTYSYEDAVEYIVSPSLFGDRLSVEMIIGNGEKIELLASGQFMGEKFFGEFDGIYEYGAYVCEKMNEGGAVKTVRERKTIEGKFFGVGDKTEEYIKRIID